MTVTGIRHGLLLICVFLGGQSDTEHFSRPWWWTDGHMAQTVLGKTSEILAPFRIMVFLADWGPSLAGQSHSQRRTLVQSGFCLLALLLHPSAPPSQVISWAPSLHHFCVSFLPRMTSLFCSPGIWSSHSREVICPPPGMSLIAPFTCH